MGFGLVIKQDEIHRLLNHAENYLPLESVALLFGVVKGSNVVVNTVELVDNSAESETTFLVDPVVQYNLLMASEEKNEDLVCIFHSHPAPPIPSSTDLRNMKLNPVVWLVASRLTGQWEYKAFLLNKNEEAEEIEIISS